MGAWLISAPVTRPSSLPYSAEELEKVLGAFEAIPLHRHYGLRFARAGDQPCVRFEVTRELAGGFDYLHGGVLYAALDIASAYTLVPRLRRGIQEKTVDVALSMIRSAKVGETVEILADVEHLGRSSAFLRVVARREGDGKLLARGQVTKTFVELDKLAAAEALERGELLSS